MSHPRDAAALRASLAERSAGVLWCHTSTWPALDNLLARVRASDAPGVRAVTVTPTSRSRPTTLATDVAVALGVDVTAAGRGRSEVQPHHLVPLLLGRPGAHLLLGSAWWTHPDNLVALSAATRAAGAAVWLLGTDPLTPQVEALLNGLGHQIDAVQVLDAFADLTGVPPLPPAQPVSPWDLVPTVPSSDFVTFLADARDQLPAADASLVEATLRAEAATATAWLGAHPDAGTATVAQALHARWDTADTWPHFLTIVRAWQIAAFHTGRLLKAAPDQLAGTAAAVPSARSRTPQRWQALRAWHEPARAAACALIAAGLGSDDALAVTVSAVSRDAATVTTPDGACIPIEADARRFLAAARAERLLAGAGPGDPLLVAPGGRAASARWVANQAHAARTTFGVPLTSAGITSRSTSGDRWATRWGLTLMDLP